MPKYIVRPRLSPNASGGSGAEGAGGTVVYTESSHKARELGAAKLGKPISQVEVIEQEDTAAIFGADVPLTQEEAAEIWNQETKAQPGSWESA